MDWIIRTVVELLLCAVADTCFFLCLEACSVRGHHLHLLIQTILGLARCCIYYGLILLADYFIDDPLTEFEDSQISVVYSFAIVVLFYAMMLISTIVMQQQPMPSFSFSSLARFVQSHGIVNCAAVWLLIPAAEELFFRGLLLERLALLTDSWLVGCSIQALWFTFNHSHMYEVRCVRSVLYGCAYIASSRSLLVCITCHAAINVTAALGGDVLNHRSSRSGDHEIPKKRYSTEEEIRCNSCMKLLAAGQLHRSCASCVKDCISMCITCYSETGTHKEAHQMVLDVVPRQRSLAHVYDSHSIRCLLKRSLATHQDLPFLSFDSRHEKICITYSEFAEEVEALIGGLMSIFQVLALSVPEVMEMSDYDEGKQVPQTKQCNHDDRTSATVAMLSENSKELIVCDYALMLMGVTSVVLPSISESGRNIGETVSLLECLHVNHLFISQSQLQRLPLPLPSHISNVIILPGDNSENHKLPFASVHSYAEVTAIGRLMGFSLVSVPEMETKKPLTLLLSSGSGRIRSCVPLSEAAMIATIREAELSFTPLSTIMFMSYSHTFTRRMVLRMLAYGGHIRICSEKREHLLSDIATQRPSWLAAPPSFWKNIVSLYQEHKRTFHEESEDQILAAFRRKNILGNRLLYIMCGGALLSTHLQATIESIFQLPLADGYASTETGTISVNGHINNNVEVRILSEDESHVDGRGEICVRSPMMTIPFQLTADRNVSVKHSDRICTYDGKTYVRTGDIGFLQSDGKLKVIDRVSSSFKLSNGKFVCASAIEEKLEELYLVYQSFVWARSSWASCVALIVPSPQFHSWNDVKESEIEMQSDMGCCDTLRQVVTSHLQGSCNYWELPALVLVTQEPFTVENGLLTQSLKRRRPSIIDRYSESLTAYYEDFVAAIGPNKRIFLRVPKLSKLLLLAIGEASSINCEKTFSQVGGNSLSAARLSELIRETLYLTVTPIFILQAPSLLSLESHIFEQLSDSSSREREDIDWESEYKLPQTFMEDSTEEILSSAVCEDAGFGDILLTGASGFLGPYLLRSILLTYLPSLLSGKDINERCLMKGITVFCIVRARDDAHAQERVLSGHGDSTFQHFYPRNENILSPGGVNLPIDVRICGIAGDLSSPLLGLSKERFCSLASSLSVIFHNASLVNGVMTYEQLKEVNVYGLIQMLKLVSINRALSKERDNAPLYFHLISSINTIPSVENAPEECLVIDAPLLRHLSSSAGYPRSKIIMELMTQEFHNLASLHGCIISIHRPATISADSRSGCYNGRCFTNIVIAGLCTLGGYPKDSAILPEHLLLTPVDWVSDAIVCCALSCESTSNIEVFHYVTPHPSPWSFIVSYIRNFGIPLQELSPQEWVQAVYAMKRDQPLYVFKDLLLSQSSSVRRHSFGPKSSKSRLLMNDIDRSSLPCTQFDCVPISQEVFFRQLERMKLDHLILSPSLTQSKENPVQGTLLSLGHLAKRTR